MNASKSVDMLGEKGMKGNTGSETEKVASKKSQKASPSNRVRIYIVPKGNDQQNHKMI